ncbi:MAG: peroxiredoxin [Gammaproteobacteria bacterium]
MKALENLNVKVIAATTEPLEKAQEVAAKIAFPVAYGVTRAQADQLGAWWEERRQIIQPSNFVLNDSGKVLSATYSTGPVGRLDVADAIRFIEFQEKQKKA